METVFHILFVLFFCLMPQAADAADCPDAAVVVVASVFATLAVVLLVLGIIGFLIWKRRRDISRPEKLKNKDGNSSPSSPNGKHGYANPAFDKDPEIGDAGYPAGYVPYSEDSPDKNKLPLGDRDMAKKTWSSLPVSAELPLGRSRKTSLGSLDRNNYAGENGQEEVWLTSQDFIGLGFNIAGSMRDGIFVSQVHNRGPATESGKFKVGDRILSVGISFENMVYEDALTILSYASPYPVKVTLQKQQQMPKNRKLSHSRINLSHPLYRSQSMDALVPSSKDSQSVNHPQRSASEMRYKDKSDSPTAPHRVSKGGSNSNIIEEISVSPFDNDNGTTRAAPISKVNAVVHRDNSGSKLAFDREISVAVDTDLPNATVDLNNIGNKNDKQNMQTDITVSDRELNDDPFEITKPNFSSAFEHLTEEDKLDVLRLTYDDPDAVVKSSFDDMQQVVHAEITPTLVNGDLKSIPSKPERKKKRSSTNSTPSQSDGEFPTSEPSSPKSPQLLPANDIIIQTLLPPTEAPPPVPESESEADEEVIMPEIKTRAVSIDNDKIVFEPVTPAKHDVSDISVDSTVIGDLSAIDTSFSDIDSTLVQSPYTANCPASPENGMVEEEEIAATQLKKEDFIIASSNLFVQSENKRVETDVKQRKLSSSGSSSSSSSSDGERDVSDIHENIDKHEANLPESVPVPEEDFERDLPALDMNLDFDNDSVLFNENFPSRNTSEKDGGIAYDISVIELNAMKEKALEEERAKSESKKGQGGIAFEIRDDVVTGSTRTVNTNSIYRTASYEISATSDTFKEREISTQRPTSLKHGTHKRHGELDSGVLDWSGKRLVRSGSFTDIPQDDSMKDWTDAHNLSEDDALIEKHIQEDSKSPVLMKLTRATLFQVNQNPDDLSDSDSQCRSISTPSSSGSSSPKRIDNNNYEGTNGEDDGLGTSPDNSPVKIIPTSGIKSELISTVSKYGENDQAYTVMINAAMDSDEDC